ncbi:DNA repair protein RadC [Kushneria indalinina DSM 14324]|uniref:DNA repair protein RadC n=1 Tax=Kushneria indalinina DSM 14324 TaxID=1122140 RepID=A0A3D9DSF7_9GAMM|nr:JAB domain-containing protein [Kushneria indalinina]REC93339.1 DNA repair protein RadC [Kushneria indalinina DSM 14324]
MVLNLHPEFTKEERTLINQAVALIEDRAFKRGDAMSKPELVKQYLLLQLGALELEHEEFFVLFLTSQHHAIAFESMFRGTIDAAAIHPREVVKAALARNAGAVVFAHNHPSGVTEPSDADRRITERLKEALALIDIRVLDHFVVGDSASEIVSMAERGMV